MKAAVISQGSKSSTMTIQELKKVFKDVDDININEIEINLGEKKDIILYQGKPIPSYDCIYAKGSFRFSTLLRALTVNLCKSAYMPIKASSFTVGHDKILTHLKFEQHKIPMPKTYLSSSIKAAQKILKKLNYPLVLKFPEGTQGKGVMFAESYGGASSLLDALSALRQPFLIQEYIDTGGVDIRAFVIGNKVIASMKRKAQSGEERANIHAGGKGEACKLDHHYQKIAVAASKAIGAEICAVDILEGAKGPLVIEINLSPGLQGVTEATQINVAEKMAKYMHEKTAAFKKDREGISADAIVKDVEENESLKEVITHLEFRGNRILLPDMISKVIKISEDDEVIIEAEKGKFMVKKFNVQNDS